MLQKDQFLFFVVTSAFSIFILFLLFIFIRILNLKRRKQKEIEALNAMIDMQEIERKRLADDMHDQIGPMLSAIKLKINAIRQMHEASEIRDVINETNSYIDVLIQDVRQVVRNLSPTNLEKQGLIQTIQDFKGVIEKNNIRFEFAHEGIENSMKEKAKINIYRIVAELINNSIRHSHCTLIKLVMKVYEKKTIILYTDNGSGNQEEQMEDHGLGLKNIESRVASFRGQLFQKKDFTDGAFYQISFDNYILMN